MPLFIVDCTDRPDGFGLRQATRPQHLQHLEVLGDQVRLAGPVLDAQDRPIGSLVILEAESLAAAEAVAAADPYARAGLFSTTRVRPWRVTLGGFGDRKA